MNRSTTYHIDKGRLSSNELTSETTMTPAPLPESELRRLMYERIARGSIIEEVEESARSRWSGR